MIIESDSGGGGAGVNILSVFGLTSGRFSEMVTTYSMLQSLDEESYTQTLDVAKTLSTRGQQVCFTKNTFLEKGHWFRPPRKRLACYQRGDVLDAEEANRRQQMLAPLEK